METHTSLSDAAIGTQGAKYIHTYKERKHTFLDQTIGLENYQGMCIMWVNNGHSMLQINISVDYAVLYC